MTLKVRYTLYGMSEGSEVRPILFWIRQGSEFEGHCRILKRKKCVHLQTHSSIVEVICLPRYLYTVYMCMRVCLSIHIYLFMMYFMIFFRWLCPEENHKILKFWGHSFSQEVASEVYCIEKGFTVMLFVVLDTLEKIENYR